MLTNVTRTLARGALCFAAFLMLSAATRIDEPKNFVTEVYRRLIAAESGARSYFPPDDIYTPRLEKLLRDDRRKAKGEVGCLDFEFWVNGQDYKLTNLAITSTVQGPDRNTVIAKFQNLGTPEEIHFDFRRNAGRWRLDDVQSVLGERWILSEILKCTP
jgi:hypothetical protein